MLEGTRGLIACFTAGGAGDCKWAQFRLPIPFGHPGEKGFFQVRICPLSIFR